MLYATTQYLIASIPDGMKCARNLGSPEIKLPSHTTLVPAMDAKDRGLWLLTNSCLRCRICREGNM